MKRTFLLIGLSGLLLNACVSASSIHTEAPQYDRHAQLAELLNSADDADSDTVFDDPASAQRFALGHAPNVQQLLADLQIQDADLWQQQLLSNPGIELGLMMPEDGGRWQLDAGITIPLIDILTRSKRLQVSESRHELWQLTALQALTLFLQDVQQAWVELVSEKHKLSIIQTITEASSVAHDLAELMYEAGNLTELDFLGYQAALAEQTIRLDQTTAKVEAAESQLRALLGLAAETTLQVPDRLPDINTESDLGGLDYETVWGMAQQNLPELQLLQAQLQLREADASRLRQEIALMSPGLHLETERESDGERQHGFAVSLAPVLFDRGQARFAALNARTSLLQSQAAQLENQLSDQLRRAFIQREQSSRSIQQLENTDLPRLEQMLNLAVQEYDFMLRGSFDLLKIRSMALDRQLQRVELLSSFWNSSAEIARFSGQFTVAQGEQHD
jgi:outer membrane protein, heavy metal efflux system